MIPVDDVDERSAVLMRAVQAGDHRALAELVERWQEPLLRFVFRYVQSETEAREVVHETFVRLHAQCGKFRDGASFHPWLLTIAANLARNRRRWWKRHPSMAWLQRDRTESEAEQPCPGVTPDRHLVEKERVDAVRAALEELPHELKVTLLLHEYEELSYKQIAMVVGCSERGVETRLVQARKRLRKALEAYLGGGAIEPVASAKFFEAR